MGEQTWETWEDDFDQIMADVMSEFEDFSNGNMTWPNNTVWNETDWDNVRQEMEVNWNQTFTDEEWNTWE